ncbi:MAG: TetR/AcrR family transcriptional regulator [Thermodesulfobacteriota bacterium]
MARPYEFNRQETLSKAMDVFWEKGYKATTVQDLVDRMGIKRGSIYNTFGDKHSLFISAIKHYGEMVTSQTIKILCSPGLPIENIKRFFYEIINKSLNRKSRGCLISNTIVELAPHDKEAAREVKKLLNKIEKAFFNCLNKAVELGELPAGTDTKVISRFFATSTHGLIVIGKSDVSRKQMKDIVKVILSILK